MRVQGNIKKRVCQLPVSSTKFNKRVTYTFHEKFIHQLTNHGCLLVTFGSPWTYFLAHHRATLSNDDDAEGNAL